MPKRTVPGASADKVDDGAAIAIVADRKVRPVAALGLAHDDLVVGRRMTQHMARAATLTPVALISVAVDRVLDQVDVALESIEFRVVHGGNLLGRRVAVVSYSARVASLASKGRFGMGALGIVVMRAPSMLR